MNTETSTGEQALPDNLASLRNQMMENLTRYRRWRAERAEAILQSSCLLCEDDLRRQQARESILLYRQMARDYRALRTAGGRHAG